MSKHVLKITQPIDGATDMKWIRMYIFENSGLEKKIFQIFFFFFICAWEENCPVYGQSRFWEFSGLPDWKWFPGRALIETIFWTNNCKIIWSKIGENLFRKLILHFGGIKHPWSFKINLLNKFSLIFKVFKGQ